MAITTIQPLRLEEPIQLSTSATSVYTCPANSYVKISAATCSNVTGTAATITFNLVPSGGAVSTSNQVITVQNVAATGSYVMVELLNQILNPGDSIFGLSSTASAINFTLSGMLMS